MGAWIETIKSHLDSILNHVASYVGAWIETNDKKAKYNAIEVASYVGAWIETRTSTKHRPTSNSRILRGCVD